MISSMIFEYRQRCDTPYNIHPTHQWVMVKHFICTRSIRKIFVENLLDIREWDVLFLVKSESRNSSFLSKSIFGLGEEWPVCEWCMDTLWDWRDRLNPPHLSYSISLCIFSKRVLYFDHEKLSWDRHCSFILKKTTSLLVNVYVKKCSVLTEGTGPERWEIKLGVYDEFDLRHSDDRVRSFVDFSYKP